ncbi:hypothetical protein VTO42DRAFT_429 [Malbranchea cinnamomea]
MCHAQDSANLEKRTQVLPVLLSPSSLRPLVFRIFTKRHDLTVTSTTLQLLSTFIGKHCGSGWREEGLAEPVLDEIAKIWKKSGGGAIVEDGQKGLLSAILRNIQPKLSGGRLCRRESDPRMRPKGLTSDPSASLATPDSGITYMTDDRGKIFVSGRDILNHGYTLTTRYQNSIDLRRWMNIVNAFRQPHFTYNAQTKQLERSPNSPSLFPPSSSRTAAFRDRYNIIHQRLLRNDAFQPTSLLPSSVRRGHRSQSFKLTPIANLQGRSGTSHLLLGLLTVTPTGDMSLTDLTGTIVLDLCHAKTVPEDNSWLAPGMIVLVDGMYEDEELASGSALLGNDGIGGVIDGKFLGFSIAGPPCERRDISLGLGSRGNEHPVLGQSFGWTDSLGVRGDFVSRMSLIEKECVQRKQQDGPHGMRSQIVIMSEVNLDLARSREAIKTVLNSYISLADERLPIVFLVIGNFASRAVMGGQGTGGSIEYKEIFDSLASVLSDFPRLLKNSTFIFVPGDNDLWDSSFSAGATTSIPKMPIPEMFTSRVRRAFHLANNESLSPGSGSRGEAIWSTNPTRLSFFGPLRELVVFRDNISGRLRRTSLNFTKSDSPDRNLPTCGYCHQNADGNPNGVRLNVDNVDGEEAAHCDSEIPRNFPSHVAECKASRQQAAKPHLSAVRKLIKTVLDQSFLAPFPPRIRPVLWDYASSLHLYPLPTALVLADPEVEPFTVTYEGCHVMNPGSLLSETCTGVIKWIEYDVLTGKGRMRELQENKGCSSRS